MGRVFDPLFSRTRTTSSCRRDAHENAFTNRKKNELRGRRQKKRNDVQDRLWRQWSRLILTTLSFTETRLSRFHGTRKNVIIYFIFERARALRREVRTRRLSTAPTDAGQSVCDIFFLDATTIARPWDRESFARGHTRRQRCKNKDDKHTRVFFVWQLSSFLSSRDSIGLVLWQVTIWRYQRRRSLDRIRPHSRKRSITQKPTPFIMTKYKSVETRWYGRVNVRYITRWWRVFCE